MTTHTSKQLRQMLSIQTQIEHLQVRLNGIASNGMSNGTTTTKRTMSPEAKARIIAAQKKRWAAWRKAHK